MEQRGNPTNNRLLQSQRRGFTKDSHVDIVLFHSGKLPGFLEYTFRQIRKFNPDVMVYFLTDTLKSDLYSKYNITLINKSLF